MSTEAIVHRSEIEKSRRDWAATAGVSQIRALLDVRSENADVWHNDEFWNDAGEKVIDRVWGMSDIDAFFGDEGPQTPQGVKLYFDFAVSAAVERFEQAVGNLHLLIHRIVDAKTPYKAQAFFDEFMTCAVQWTSLCDTPEAQHRFGRKFFQRSINMCHKHTSEDIVAMFDELTSELPF